MGGLEELPWRGPGPERPDLPLTPQRLPLRRAGTFRKRWRYVGAYCDQLLLCAARVQVGPMGQTFWAIWDREGRRLHERTRRRLPGARGEVWTEALESEGIRDHAPQKGSLVRIESRGGNGEQVRAFLRFGGGQWVESVCPSGEGDGYVWTRKRAGVPVECDVRVGDDRWRIEALGVEDESEGYHPHHTVWSWSAGVGRSAEGRSLAWNLVSGINDPPQRSERAIWVDGDPFEPGPVSFEDLDAISFDDGSRLSFSGECERRREQRVPFVRYKYRQPFGTFSGSLPGGLDVVEGLGVMEYHDAHW